LRLLIGIYSHNIGPTWIFWANPVTFALQRPAARLDLPRRDRVRHLFGLHKHSPVFRAFNRSPAVCGVLCELFGSGGVYNMFGDMVFVKPPNGGVRIGKHPIATPVRGHQKNRIYR
jgi:hypothetical protein